MDKPSMVVYSSPARGAVHTCTTVCPASASMPSRSAEQSCALFDPASPMAGRSALSEACSLLDGVMFLDKPSMVVYSSPAFRGRAFGPQRDMLAARRASPNF
ncbi:hypothetical protein [Gynuella sunshinyii]|uniref:hypothetical protein n=1 Tax=Gynuella sunshinyii TaxID=1445505 RepID=UPI0011858125|nr:hypothetical protein [Gynuella sunshinyii]